MEDVNKPPFPAPDDQELKNIVDKLANFVARNGSKFEEMTKQKQKDNSKFGFLYSGHTYYNYYRWKVSMEIAKSQTQQYQQSQKQQTPQLLTSQSAIVQQAIVQQSIKSAPWQQAQQPPTLPQMPAIPPPSYTAPLLTQSVYQQAPQPPSDLDLKEFDGMLQKLMDTGSKDAISSGRGWVFNNAKSSQHCQYIMEYILKRSLEPDLQFSQKLHIVYIINDVLHHIARKSVQDLHKAVQEVVVPIFLNAMKGETGDGLKKLNKVLGIWETNKFLDTSVMQKLKNPESSEPILQAALQKFHPPPAATYGYPQQPTLPVPPGEYQTNPYQYQQYYQQYAQYSSNTAAYGQPPSTADTGGQQESKDSAENQAPPKSSEESNEAINEKEEEMLEENASKETFNQDHHNTDKQQPSKERGLQDGQQFQPPPYNQPPPFPPFYPSQGPPPQFPPDYRAPFPPFPIPPPSFNRLPPHFNEPQNFHDPGFPGRPPFGPGPPPHSYDYPPPRDEYEDMPPAEYDRHEEIDDYGPPEGFDRGMPPHVPPPPRPIIPNAMYYELPAGLMAPMVKLTDVDYKPLDPHEIRLPAPQPPSERLLAAVEAFYSPPSHERPRNSDGWEQSGLFEFYKAKLPFIKEREVRDKEREAREKVERPTERGRSKSKSTSPARSPEGRRRSRSPPRGRSRSVSPPYRRTSRSRSKSPSYRRSSRSRSRSPRRYSRSRSRSPPRRRHRSRSKSRSRSRSRSRSPRHRRRSVSPLRRRSITPPSFGAFMTSNPESRLDESNVGHQLLKKMGWEGAGLGKDEKGIQDPIKAAEARHRHNQYKGIGMELNDAFDNFRYNRSYTYNRSQAERKK